jgi:hypothetical protein
MKKAFLLIPLICSFLVHSCSDNKTKDHDTQIQDQTPEVLDNSKPEISSISKRYASDIVQDLFNEAISKDPKLKVLTEKMDEIGKIKNDSLKPLRDYFQNNDNYWESANRYIGQLSDSLLKNELKEIIKDLESDYRKSISNHNFVIKSLDDRTHALNDREILMKLLLTFPMITNYQKNELPDLNSLNNLMRMYDTIIKETDEYSDIVK